MTIVLRSLVVCSDDTMLVDGVELSLAPGSRTALVGASGAGKSLTCAALAGTLPAGLETSGSLTVEADALARLPVPAPPPVKEMGEKKA